jgi:Mg-chelatase subunit ChlD
MLSALALVVWLCACDDQTSQTKSQTASQNATTDSAGSTVNSDWPGEFKTPTADLTTTNIMVVYDASGSMGNSPCGSNERTKHDEGAKAISEFLSAIPSDANLGLFVFNGDRSGLKLPLGTNNREQFMVAIKSIVPDGSTPLRSAMTIGIDQLTEQAKHQLGYGRYVLLVVTDGEADGGEDPSRLVNYVVANTPIEIHAVGVCMSSTHSLRREGMTFYTAATDPKTLVAGLKSVLAEVDDVNSTDFIK